MSGPRTTSLAVLALAALVALTFVVPPHLHPENYPADDSFFYLQVASHITAGHGSTFHTITPTNGYHPLWMLFCVLSNAVAGGSRIGALRVAIAIQQAMALGIVWIFLRIARRMGLKHAVVAVPLLLLFFSTRLYASEAYLNGLFLLAAVLAGLPPATVERSYGRCVLLGVLGALAMLARLDNVFAIAVLFSLVMLDEARWRIHSLFAAGRIARAVAIGVPALLVLAPYIVLNQLHYGHAVPISGSIKSTLPEFVFNVHAISNLGKVGLAASAVGLLLAALKDSSRAARLALGALSAGAWLQALQIVFTTRHHTGWPWYYVPGMMVTGWVGAWLVERAQSIPSPRLQRAAAWPLAGTRLAVLALAAGLAINGYAWARYRTSAPIIRQSFEPARLFGPSETRWQMAVGRWLELVLPPEAGVMVYDWPGMIAYTATQRILPPDGLINDFQYNDDILRMGIGPYLQSKNVDYWLGPVDAEATPDQYWYEVRERDDELEVEVFSPLYRKSAGSFLLKPKERVARLRDAIAHPDLPDLALWRISAAGGTH